jgi:flagellar motor switch/type III secretory pathway protein FliN
MSKHQPLYNLTHTATVKKPEPVKTKQQRSDSISGWLSLERFADVAVVVVVVVGRAKIKEKTLKSVSQLIQLPSGFSFFFLWV